MRRPIEHIRETIYVAHFNDEYYNVSLHNVPYYAECIFWDVQSWKGGMIDWLTELRFYIPLDTKQVISEMFHKPISWLPQANLLAWYGKTKPNTTKSHIHKSKQMYYNIK